MTAPPAKPGRRLRLVLAIAAAVVVVLALVLYASRRIIAREALTSWLQARGIASETEVKAFGHGGSDGTGAWAFPAENLIVCYFTQSRGQASTIRLETTIKDALLTREDAKGVPDLMKPLIGTYYANFGPFKEAPFQVVFRCGKLALDVPTELVNELGAPDREGRWKLLNSNSNSVSFKKDGEGKVLALLLHKPNTTFELPRDKSVDAERPKK